MSLPFLNPKKIVPMIMVQHHQKVVGFAHDGEDNSDAVDPDLKSIASDLLRAVQKSSVDEIAKALQAAYEICENYEEPKDDESEGDESESGDEESE